MAGECGDGGNARVRAMAAAAAASASAVRRGSKDRSYRLARSTRGVRAGLRGISKGIPFSCGRIGEDVMRLDRWFVLGSPRGVHVSPLDVRETLPHTRHSREGKAFPPAVRGKGAVVKRGRSF